MKITSKVGAILGRKQKSEDATFGEPLNLGQIALSDAIESEPSLAESETELVAPEREPTSILDLDFMAAPLAEIELIQEKEQNNPSPVDEADVTSPDVDSDQARLQQDVIQSTDCYWKARLVLTIFLICRMPNARPLHPILISYDT